MARGRPLLPRGGATALGGGATELMGDVVIFLLSERQTDKQTGETETERGGQTGGEDKRMWKKKQRREERRKKKKKKSGDGSLSLEVQYCSRPPGVSVHTSETKAATF